MRSVMTGPCPRCKRQKAKANGRGYQAEGKGQKAADEGQQVTLKGKVLPPVVREQKPTGVPLLLAGTLLWSTSL